MAQKKSTATNQRKPASGSSSAKKGTAASRSARPIPKPQPQIPEEKEPLYSVIWSYSWGKALYLLLGILVLIGLDLHKIIIMIAEYLFGAFVKSASVFGNIHARYFVAVLGHL